jgi:thiosulfate dehydrogenase [quinone] large subunit
MLNANNESIQQLHKVANQASVLFGIGLSFFWFFVETAAIAGALLIFLYILSNPRLIDIEYTLPVEGNNLIENKTLIEAVALFVLVFFFTGKIFGFDVFWAGRNT